MHPTDESLIAETLSGSHAAFESLMVRYESLVFKTAWTYAHQREAALDIAQDVFVKAYRGLRTYRGEGAFRSWLMGITHHESRNWLRRNGRHLETVDLDTIDSPSVAPRQEDALQREESRRYLLDQLDKLNDRQRQALTMRYFETASVGEIALALDCSPGTARNLLFRGLQKMREGLHLSHLKSSWSSS